ncbi:hypothetical protein NDU88_004060 [Pleurodeles waltl]|uniref:Uncharacterized protein n=1 Tax=Pleurodeles waltl TaxID=8319 RepID=A0AAV7WVF0_PLEWA|nr:hypothetical protein NDU88_004060 [Pleurodeles waltl]
MTESSIDDQRPSQEKPAIRTMFLDLKHSLTTTDTKIGLLDDIFDHLKERVGLPDERKRQLEHRMSEMEDGHSATSEKLLRMERVLAVSRTRMRM